MIGGGDWFLSYNLTRRPELLGIALVHNTGPRPLMLFQEPAETIAL